ncbi:MAG: hypothetical protein AAF358_06985 [Pseudomonadota bacterium]
MNVLRVINQSFRQVVYSIAQGLKHTGHSINRAIRAFGNLIGTLHDLIATAIQVILNISSVAFVTFLPFALFFDPLNWSEFLSQYANPEVIFLARIALGVFFLYVVFLLFIALWKALREPDPTTNGDADLNKKGFLRFISSMLSWMTIGLVFIYFTMYRFEVFGIRAEEIPGVSWLIEQANLLI